MKKCSFCGSVETKENRLLAGKDNHLICENCVISAYKIFFGDTTSVPSVDFDIANFSPKTLKDILDQYVIGQNQAKKTFSVAVYNHYKRLFKQADNDDVQIQKSNVLFIGPTGSGKTLLAQTLAKYLDVPLAIADATSLTEAGYVGEDVENILTKLLQAADNDIQKAQKGIIFIDEIDKISRLGENRSITRDVSGEGVQQALLKIIEGSSVNIPPKGGRKHPNQEFTQIDTSNILFVCGGAFDGLNDIVKKRIGNNVLGFNQVKRTKKEEENLISQVEPDDLVKFGLIPELIGRLHAITTLNELTEDDMVEILSKPKNSLVKQYQKLFEIDDVILTFDDDALKQIASLAIERRTGARGLRTILEDIMMDIMFNLPDYRGYEVVITKDVVLKEGKPLYIKNKQAA
jgi:ATP-dependent Clp protease ATP-binding subunit ClpX